MTQSSVLSTRESNARALLVARTREVEALVMDIAETEVELGTLCAETISAVRNLAAHNNARALSFLILAARQIEEVLA